MMSWLEEEIGIPPEPKHPKAVGPAIQTAVGRETEPVREGEGEGERKKTREMGAWVDLQCQDQSVAPLGWQGGAHSRDKCVYACLGMGAICLPWTSSSLPASSSRPHVTYAVLLKISSLVSLLSSSLTESLCLTHTITHLIDEDGTLNKSGCDALHGFLPSQWWDTERWWGEGDREQGREGKRAREREQQRE